VGENRPPPWPRSAPRWKRIDEHRAEPVGALRLKLAAGCGAYDPVAADLRIHAPLSALCRSTWSSERGDGGTSSGKASTPAFVWKSFVPPDMIAVPITRPIRSIVVGSPAYFAGAEAAEKRRLTWRSIGAFAGARGAARSTAGSLKKAWRGCRDRRPRAS